jgi:hypothetical protein
MSTATTAAEVAELAYKVHAVAVDEAVQRAMFAVMPGRNDSLDWAFFSDFELDMNDWGLAFGVAFAIARGERPYAPAEDVAALALEAAKSAYDTDHDSGPWARRIRVDREDRGPLPGSEQAEAVLAKALGEEEAA